MKYKTGDRIKAICNYYSKASGRILFTKGKSYPVRVGTNGTVYVVTDRKGSEELTVTLEAMVFDRTKDDYDYAMGIL